MHAPQIEQNVPLAEMTTIGIGGPARYFVDAQNESDIIAAIDLAQRSELDLFVIGGGSNVLISDSGFDGLVLKISIGGVHFDDNGDASTIVTAGAGVVWDDLVSECVNRGLQGIECLSGIPGSVGGTPVQNVGAYGQEVADVVVSVRCFDRSRGEFVTLTDRDCGFAYRKSIFNTTHRGRFIVTEVKFRLKNGEAPHLVYKDLVTAAAGRMLDLSQTREAVLNIRRAKSMVIDANDQNSRSLGSFFKNPIVSEAFAGSIADVPTFPAGDGSVKLSAAWLIEQAGFPKGFSLGRAAISANHSLALINKGGASAADIIELKEMIARGVAEKFGIELQQEPVMVGFDTKNE